MSRGGKKRIRTRGGIRRKHSREKREKVYVIYRRGKEQIYRAGGRGTRGDDAPMAAGSSSSSTLAPRRPRRFSPSRSARIPPTPTHGGYNRHTAESSASLALRRSS